MAEKAPMPPWWVERKMLGKTPLYAVMGGSKKKPIQLFYIDEYRHSNAKELADLIVQRTKP